MRKLLILFCVFGSATAVANTDRDAEVGAAELMHAIKKHDAAAIAAMLQTPMQFGGVWSADAACKKFVKGGVVQTKDKDAFAKCLVKLSPMLSTRRAPELDAIVLTIEPGVELELAFNGLSLRWVGPVGARATDTGEPLLTAQTFEALRTSGTTLLDAKVRGDLAGIAGAQGESTWMKTCIDEKGAVTVRTPFDAPNARVAAAFEKATDDWAFKPFAPKGVAIKACSLSLLTYPAAKAPSVETLPAYGAPPLPAQTFDLDDILFDP
ncbi:MAG TPA: hypothetical protein VGM90_23630 [Kofleriaceae bacterium]|jgi:hypothetical protein